MRCTCFIAALAITTAVALPAAAQTAVPSDATTPASAPAAPPVSGAPAESGATPLSVAAAPIVGSVPNVTGIKPPADYVIGVDDQLEVVYWQDKDMSASVTVRPDGNISLPLVNEVKAAGLTPEELRKAIAEAAAKFIEDPTVSVGVTAINSRKVFITGQIAKPGSYPLTDSMTVLQMIATAGGPNEYAKSDKITILRRENGKDVAHKFNYKNVSQGKSLEQNISLKPGDTIVIP